MYFSCADGRQCQLEERPCRGFGQLDTIENDSCWVCARPVLDDIDADSLAPNIELSMAAARTCRSNEQDVFSGRLVLCREFADRCRLADPVNAEKQNHPCRAENGVIFSAVTDPGSIWISAVCKYVAMSCSASTSLAGHSRRNESINFWLAFTPTSAAISFFHGVERSVIPAMISRRADVLIQDLPTFAQSVFKT